MIKPKNATTFVRIMLSGSMSMPMPREAPFGSLTQKAGLSISLAEENSGSIKHAMSHPKNEKRTATVALTRLSNLERSKTRTPPIMGKTQQSQATRLMLHIQFSPLLRNIW